MTPSLTEKLKTLPNLPGVYLFKDADGRVLYIGKAINLKRRVRQYFGAGDGRPMIPFLQRAMRDLELIVTQTEKEALILESNLIKKLTPRYNTMLRDDKSFLHLRIDPSKPWARYTLVRKTRSDNAHYFGPFHAASKARETLGFLERSFPLRTCSDMELKSRRRPCLLHQMGRCVAPCANLSSPEDYRAFIDESLLFLEGKSTLLTGRLTDRMERASDEEAYEEAARIRDLLKSVQITMERQAVASDRDDERDIWGLYREGSRGLLTVLPVREGALGRPHFHLFSDIIGASSDWVSSALNLWYNEKIRIPSEILLPLTVDDHAALTDVLSDRRGRRTRLVTPRRGDKRAHVEMANQNAQVHFMQQTSEVDRRSAALTDLAEVLGLDTPPRRIECFDNSNIGGEHPVAAMSVFIDGAPDRAEYRRYKIKTVVGADDYASMAEIISRRLVRGLREEALPDLIVVDGGRGQLNVALNVRDTMGLSAPPIIGIVKPRTAHKNGRRDATDRLVLEDEPDPLELPANHLGLRLIQYLRDEVHKHAITYHRSVRRKDALMSVLSGVPGVGPKRQKRLLRELGSARAVAQASEAELAEVDGIGPELARTLFNTFRTG